MVICIVALAAFSVLSAFSAKYREPARRAFRCVLRNITLRPCDVGLEQEIRAKVTGGLMFSPSLARFVYGYFSPISWLFTAAFFASTIYSVYSIYNYFIYGSCEPGGVCVITWIGWCILLIERMMVYVVLGILAIVLGYLGFRKIRRRHT